MNKAANSRRVMMVTRERGADRRYGLGRSIVPIQRALEARGIEVRYLCQDDLLARDFTWRERCLRWLWAFPLFRKNDRRKMLLSALFERIQMGFRAGKVATAEGYACVHVHDPFLALGAWLFQWLKRFDVRRGRGRARWRLYITEHGFGAYTYATRADGLAQSACETRMLLKLEAWMLAQADGVFVPTQLGLQQLANDLMLDRVPSHWHRVPHAKTDRPTLIHRWGLGSFGILNVFRFKFDTSRKKLTARTDHEKRGGIFSQEAIARSNSNNALMVYRNTKHKVPTLQNAQSIRAVTRRALQFSEDDFYILGIGRFVPLKQFDILIEAFARAARVNERLKLYLLGNGERDALQRLAQDLGVLSRIEFAFVEEVQPFLVAADLYVSTSRSESFGLANFEALSAGLPCVCTAVGGVAEVMGDGAYLLPYSEASRAQLIEQLADILLKFAEDREFCEQFRARARARYEACLGADEIAQIFLEHYQLCA